MSAKFPIFFGISILLLVLGLWFGWFSTSDSRLVVNGEVLKVRTLELTPETTLVMLDFRMRNESSIDFVLKEATLVWTSEDGGEHEMDPVARPDLDRILQYAKQAGPKFNEMFVMREKLGGKAMADRMAAGVAKASEPAFAKRKNLVLRIMDLDGKIFELKERTAAK